MTERVNSFVKDKILLIVDSINSSNTIKSIFDKNYNVIIAVGIYDAMEMLYRNNHFGAIIIDANISKINIDYFLNEQKNNNNLNNIPTIVIIAEEDNEIIEDFFSLGAIDIFTIPINPLILLNRVDNLIESNNKVNLIEKEQLRSQEIY